MAAIDLTTLNNVKVWWQQAMGNVSTADDLIALEITRVSSMVLAWLDRGSILSQSYTDTYSGTGGTRLPLRMFPVTSISSLIVNNMAVTPGPANAVSPSAWTGQAGYYLDAWDGIPPGRQQLLSVVGARFTQGYSNVTVTYTAGFLQANEQHTIPASGSLYVYPNSVWGLCAADAGVTYASTGDALTAVASNPTVGQYVAPSPLDRTPRNYWEFAAADAGVAVKINYSFVPYAIEGAVAELVAERLSYRQRIGQQSKQLGGQETASYLVTDLPDWVRTSLQPFRRVPTVF